MINYLLDASSTISQWSDLLTTKWAEILGWISIPTVVTAIICCSFKLITACLNKKIAAKNVKPLADKVSEAKQSLLSTVNEIKAAFDKNINEYSQIIEDKVKNAILSYENSKKATYNKIMAKNLELKNAIGEVELKVETQKEVLDAKVNDTVNKVEEINKIIDNAAEDIKRVGTDDNLNAR